MACSTAEASEMHCEPKCTASQTKLIIRALCAGPAATAATQREQQTLLQMRLRVCPKSPLPLEAAPPLCAGSPQHTSSCASMMPHLRSPTTVVETAGRGGRSAHSAHMRSAYQQTCIHAHPVVQRCARAGSPDTHAGLSATRPAGTVLSAPCTVAWRKPLSRLSAAERPARPGPEPAAGG